MNIEDLIEGCKQNNKQSQYLLYKYYSPKLKPTIRKYCKDERDVDEVLNDSFLRIFKNINSYKHLGSFEGWMKIITTHSAINRIRIVKDQIYNSKTSFNIVDDLYEKYTTPTYETKQQYDVIFKMLPTKTEKVIRLNMLGYKYNEIANMFGVSENTIKSHMFVARKKLNSIICI
jgi:RNA polymerase sigma-70 factor (ECF subfamily)